MRKGGDRWEVVQVLLALTIISAIAAVSSALSALNLLPERGRPQPSTLVIVVNDIKVLTADHQPDLVVHQATAAGLLGHSSTAVTSPYLDHLTNAQAVAVLESVSLPPLED